MIGQLSVAWSVDCRKKGVSAPMQRTRWHSSNVDKRKSRSKHKPEHMPWPMQSECEDLLELILLVKEENDFGVMKCIYIYLVIF